MNGTLLALLLGALVAGLGGLLVPRLIASVPEPQPKQATDEPPKMLYADIAARPGLALRSALVSAAAGGVLGAATGLDWPLLWLVPLTPVAVALSVVDWHTRLLPRVVVVPATLATLAAVVVVGLATGERSALLWALGGMVGLRSFFWLLWFIRSAGMGFGDVRLAALVGLVLGWAGADVLLFGAWIGFVSFALPGLALAIVRRDKSLLKKPFPYGPFMVGGALVGLVWGTAIAGGLWG
ncbi:leader peptidase (prepilin peptidase)/N-methyltransferase [Nocardioides sp. BE266]|uniref:A24 family peptidase n=1 Tax=Nocardioides sp. BE266 TaxID=2817725 RepID=UPI002866FB7B|nr:A24 family peptidase [Nocardioides sp. BE266]MDR7253945.1 leader peptidase (prepilin peptidase)/N-methyltransferase [Nocardioides sp. BE266]